VDKPIGLRVIKKQQTREALISSAYKLFEQRGYRKTSIENITEDAQYASRTFFLHFTSKDDLLFPDTDMLRESLETVLQSRLSEQSTLQALKGWILGVVSYKETQDVGYIRLRRRIINSEALLKGREKIYLSDFETMLANAIAIDLGLHVDDIEPKMIAAAALAVFAAIDAHVDRDLTRKDAKEMINMGIAFLEGGLAVI
jgi:AcrR family transcriptional regulator